MKIYTEIIDITKNVKMINSKIYIVRKEYLYSKIGNKDRHGKTGLKF